MFTGSDLGGKMIFLGTKNVPFRANGLLTSSVVIELFKRKKKKKGKKRKTAPTTKIIESALSPSAYYKLTFCLWVLQQWLPWQLEKNASSYETDNHSPACSSQNTTKWDRDSCWKTAPLRLFRSVSYNWINAPIIRFLSGRHGLNCLKIFLCKVGGKYRRLILAFLSLGEVPWKQNLTWLLKTCCVTWSRPFLHQDLLCFVPKVGSRVKVALSSLCP